MWFHHQFVFRAVERGPVEDGPRCPDIRKPMLVINDHTACNRILKPRFVAEYISRTPAEAMVTRLQTGQYHFFWQPFVQTAVFLTQLCPL